MAVSSRDRRFSMLGMALAAPSVLPNPDGSLGTSDDKAQMLYLYRGILPAYPGEVQGTHNYLLLRRRLRRPSGW